MQTAFRDYTYRDRTPSKNDSPGSGNGGSVVGSQLCINIIPTNLWYLMILTFQCAWQYILVHINHVGDVFSPKNLSEDLGNFQSVASELCPATLSPKY